MRSLDDFDVGEKFIAYSIKYEKSSRKNIEIIGLHEGSSVEIISKNKRNPTILSINNYRYFINRKEAQKIYLSRED